MTPSPQAEYQSRLAARRGELARETARLDRLGRGRVGVFAAGVVAALLGYFAGLYPPWLGLAAILPFAVLAFRYDTARRRVARVERAVRFYGTGWTGWPASRAARSDGGRFADDAHPYAADLDLFGPGSVFERLNAVPHPGGEDTLAAWLQGRPPTRPRCRPSGGGRRPAAAARPARVARGRRGRRPAGADYANLAAWGAAAGSGARRGSGRAVEALGWANVLAVLGWLVAGTTVAAGARVRLPVVAVSPVPLLGWARRVLGPVEKPSRRPVAARSGPGPAGARSRSPPRGCMHLQAAMKAGRATGVGPDPRAAGAGRLVQLAAERAVPAGRDPADVGRAVRVQARGVAAAVRPGGRRVAAGGGRGRGPVVARRVRLREPGRPVPDGRPTGRRRSPRSGSATRCCRPTGACGTTCGSAAPARGCCSSAGRTCRARARCCGRSG